MVVTISSMTRIAFTLVLVSNYHHYSRKSVRNLEYYLQEKILGAGWTTHEAEAEANYQHVKWSRDSILGSEGLLCRDSQGLCINLIKQSIVLELLLSNNSLTVMDHGKLKDGPCNSTPEPVTAYNVRHSNLNTSRIIATKAHLSNPTSMLWSSSFVSGLSRTTITYPVLAPTTEKNLSENLLLAVQTGSADYSFPEFAYGHTLSLKPIHAHSQN